MKNPVKITTMPRLIVLVALFSAVLVSCSPPHVRRDQEYLGNTDRGRVIGTARRYLGVPYRYGGTSPRGFDCSGFVMYVFRKNGYPMPRSTTAQFSEGRRVNIREARPGDLVFFNTSRGKRISHVGIYVGGGKFIHAPRTGKRISYAHIDNRYWKRRYIGTVSYFSAGRYRGMRYSLYTGTGKQDGG